MSKGESNLNARPWMSRWSPGARWSAAALLILGVAVGRAATADDLKDGRTALQAGHYDEALKAFEKAAQQGLAAGRAGVGQVWLARRQYEKAMDAFQTAQKMDGNLAMAYYGQGEVLRRQDKCTDAVSLLQRATELDRRFPEAQLGLGDCLVKTHQFDKGVAALSEGLKWGPKWRPRFLVALGGAELARDSLRDAGIYFTKAKEEAPDDPQVRRALGDDGTAQRVLRQVASEREPSPAARARDPHLGQPSHPLADRSAR